MTTLDLDELQQRWLAQDRKLDQALRINARLWQRSEMEAPRASLRWLRYGAVFNIVLGALCLLGSGSFIADHWGEWQLVLPGLALHGWLIAALACSVAELARASGIDYDAPIVTLQARLQALRVFNLQALRALFVAGVPVWTVSIGIVAAEALIGLDLNEVFGSAALFEAFVAMTALGVLVVWTCGLIGQRFASVPAIQQLVRGLSGYNLAQAESRLAELAAFERSE